jgi:hypothetical protein
MSGVDRRRALVGAAGITLSGIAAARLLPEEVLLRDQRRTRSRVAILSALEYSEDLADSLTRAIRLLDKGALRRPMLPEALALSILDLLDARMEQVFRTIDSAPDGDEFTPYVPSLERQLFRGFTAETGGQLARGGKAS